MTYLEIKDLFKKMTFVPLEPVLLLRIIKNYYRLIFLKKKVPRNLNIWATWKCQCNCKHCCNDELKRSGKKSLALKDFEKIFTSAEKLGVINIHFLGGEPLLCEEICELIRLAKSKRMLVSLGTNGILLKHKARELKKAGLDLVNVSLDSPFAEIHDRNRDFIGAFESAISGIITAKNTGIKVIVSMCVTHQNLNNKEVEKMILLTEKFRVDLQLIPAKPVGKLKNRRELLLRREDISNFHHLASRWRVRWDGRTNYFETGCPAGTERIAIDIFGNVYPCDFILVPFGNIYESSLEDIYYLMSGSSEFKKRIPICRSAFGFDKDISFKKD